MLRGRPPLHQRVLHALRSGLAYREIADKLQTNEKTIRRLVRRLDRDDAHA
jgi:DNA-binding NarL/FixJ family response regulator